MYMQTTRSIVCMIFGTFVLVFSVLCISSFLPSHSLHANWVRDVHAITDKLVIPLNLQDAKSAQDALLQLHIDGNDKEQHLALVISLVAVQQQKPDAQKQFIQNLKNIK